MRLNCKARISGVQHYTLGSEHNVDLSFLPVQAAQSNSLYLPEPMKHHEADFGLIISYKQTAVTLTDVQYILV